MPVIRSAVASFFQLDIVIKHPAVAKAVVLVEIAGISAAEGNGVTA